LFWDPTASRIAYLDSPLPPAIELGVAEIDGAGAAPTSLGSGRPFYLSWNPSGKQMLVHVGANRLQQLAIDGTRTTVDAHPGAFNVPFWTADGRRFVYASETAKGQRLVVRDRDKKLGRELVRFDGAIRFVVSPDGDRIAFQVIQTDSVGPLTVVDRATGDFERVASGVAPAFFWSPAGDRLLYLTPETEEGRVWFRWGVWGGESPFTTPRFVPSAMFGSAYLQFFEQYAQSMSLWAPDGSAFTYAGESESGETGIWVQPARPGAEPALVAKGDFATWSPG
jgi:dipeptidyl aminopeptidase/acylaminoacyl peptidase